MYARVFTLNDSNESETKQRLINEQNKTIEPNCVCNENRRFHQYLRLFFVFNVLRSRVNTSSTKYMNYILFGYKLHLSADMQLR